MPSSVRKQYRKLFNGNIWSIAQLYEYYLPMGGKLDDQVIFTDKSCNATAAMQHSEEKSDQTCPVIFQSR